jgi:hypothetical protein
MRNVRVFVSSPGDAQFERMRIDRVVERLNGEFANVAHLDTIRWEREFYTAHATFQDQIPQACDCDVVVAILRHRLGTELPDDFPRMPNGEPYPSGTAYEVLTAMEARKKSELPDIYVFRYPEAPLLRLGDPDHEASVKEQWSKVQLFFETWFHTPEGHFKAAFHEFSSTDEFESQVEALLRGWLEEKVLKGRSVVWSVEAKGSPFRGLAAFGPKHTPVFFGRRRDTARATDAIKDAAGRGVPFLLIVGASGSGKSSLAHAGLVPRLTTPGVVPTVDVWRVAAMRPSEHPDGPLAALAASLFVDEGDLGDEEQGRPVALPEIKNSDYGTPAELVDLMRHGDATVARPIMHTLDRIAEFERAKSGYERPVSAQLLLVIDQLDELFADVVSEDERQAFARVLAHLAGTGRTWILATLRADLYERFLKQPELLQLKTGGATHDLAPPGSAELTEIVRSPAQAANLVFESDPKSGETLDDRLLRDADRPDMLPLLQFALEELFRQRKAEGQESKLTFAAYRSFGGIDGAIDRAGEQALKELGTAEVKSLARLLRLLLRHGLSGETAGPGRNFTLHSAPLAEIKADTAMHNLAQALAAARLLVMADDGAGGTVRLAHQRIVDSWSRAREVVRNNAGFYRIHSDVRAQLSRWIASGGHPSTLLPAGPHLRDARELERRFGTELEPKLRFFVRASIWRRRFIAGNIGVLPGMIALAIFIYVMNSIGLISPEILFPAASIFIAFAVWLIATAFFLWRLKRNLYRLVSILEKSDEVSMSSALGQLLRRRLKFTSTNVFFMTLWVAMQLISNPIVILHQSGHWSFLSEDSLNALAALGALLFAACWIVAAGIRYLRVRRAAARLRAVMSADRQITDGAPEMAAQSSINEPAD